MLKVALIESSASLLDGHHISKHAIENAYREPRAQRRLAQNPLGFVARADPHRGKFTQIKTNDTGRRCVYAAPRRGLTTARRKRIDLCGRIGVRMQAS